LLGDRKDIQPIKNPFHLCLQVSIVEKVEEENPKANWLTQVRLEKHPLTGSSSGTGSDSSIVNNVL